MSFDRSSPKLPPPTSPPSTTRRTFHVEPGSPTKQRSPLRQSISYTDPPELPCSRPSSWDAIESPKLQLGSPVMALTGDRRMTGDGTQARRPSWFSRGTTPPANNGQSQEDASSTDTTPVRRPQSRASQASTPQISPSNSSRFGFFTSSMSALKGLTSSPTATIQDDELLNLDIQAALFPSGPPSDRDTFSPAAFKNLQMTATGLLQKYQTAYQRRTAALRDVKAEQEAKSDDDNEADLRAHHLKLQLEEMARKAAEQESIMLALMEELNREKKLRMKERSTRGRGHSTAGCSTVSEDLGAEEDQRFKWRESDASAKSDLSFETDEESTEEASVFSRSRSPTIAASLSDASTVDMPPTHSKPSNLEPPRLHKQLPPQPISAFQKLLRGISHDGTKVEEHHGGTDSCRNCQGQEVSVAWDTVSLLRDENRGLKQRVGELETAVEGALDAVNGLTL
ncbi:hypothetical protein HJFPF1_03615 [Paramyrothecium foliicola]|nr:hypothetical protein HJFPF1_03615 [Paramyrothecium foliicola]